MTASPQTTDQLIEAVVMRSEQEFGKDAFVRAKDEFHTLFGKVFPEDPFFESRMSYFLDHFVLLRPLPGQGPATPFLRFAPALIDDPERGGKLIEAMESFRHSVFEILTVSPEDGMTIRDLRTGDGYNVRRKHNESFRGFTVGALFQGFVFPDGDSAWLGNGLIVHPPQVAQIIRKYLKSLIKSVDFDEQAMLARLAWVQLKAVRHSHAGAKRIYGTEIGNF
ncbi:MAG: hypothetical protein RIQ81_124 [Pseudomonadota bacterium]